MRIKETILLNKSERVEYFNMCMAQSVYPMVKSTGVEEVRSVKPKHNWASHYRSSFEYLCLGLAEFKTVRHKPYDKFKKQIRSKRLISY